MVYRGLHWGPPILGHYSVKPILPLYEPSTGIPEIVLDNRGDEGAN